VRAVARANGMDRKTVVVHYVRAACVAAVQRGGVVKGSVVLKTPM
jgi:hypothetical protein